MEDNKDIRTVQRDNGEIELQIKNDKGDVHPDIFPLGNEKEKYIYDNLRKILKSLLDSMRAEAEAFDMSLHEVYGFPVSHSDDWDLLAFALHRGIDYYRDANARFSGKEQKPSVLDKLNKFEQSVTETAKDALAIDKESKQHEHRQEER